MGAKTNYNVLDPRTLGSIDPINNAIFGTDTGGTGAVGQAAAAAAPAEEGGGGEDWANLDLPPMTYIPTPTPYEQDWMDKFKVGAYEPWAQGVVDKSYGQLGTDVESIYKRLLGTPDTSMFVYPESTIAPLGQLGDIVKGYYTDYKNYAFPQWQQNIKPTIAEQYSGPGYWGSARADAISKSLNDLGGQIGVAEASDTARARQSGLLGQVAARLAVDEGKRNYLSNWSSNYGNSLTSALTNIAGAKSNALNTLLSSEPVTTGAVGSYSRQFVEPKINPEFVAAANWYSSLLGQTAFDTAGWLDKTDTSWSNLLGGLATTLGQGASKFVSDLGTKSSATPSFNYTTLPDLANFGASGSNTGSNVYNGNFSTPSGAAIQSGNWWGGQQGTSGVDTSGTSWADNVGFW